MSVEKVTAYFSHAIRGSAGKSASREFIEENCKEAVNIASMIRRHIPKLDIWVPAEYEPWIQVAYDMKYLTVEQILKVDCKIIETKDLLIVHNKNGWEGGGIKDEIARAEEKNIPIIRLNTKDNLLLPLSSIERLKKVINELLEKKEMNRKKKHGWVLWCKIYNKYVREVNSCLFTRKIREAAVFSTRQDARKNKFSCDRVCKISINKDDSAYQIIPGR